MNRLRLLAFVFGSFSVLGIGFALPTHQAEAAQATTQSTAKSSSNPDAIENDDSLNLTQDQKDKIKSIREDAKKQKQDIEKDKTLTPGPANKAAQRYNQANARSSIRRAHSGAAESLERGAARAAYGKETGQEQLKLIFTANLRTSLAKTKRHSSAKNVPCIGMRFTNQSNTPMTISTITI